MTHEEADKEAKILFDEYKAEHFEKLCGESRQLTEWHEREHTRDLNYWKETEYDHGESGDDQYEGEGSESEEAESEDDGASNSAGMDTDLPEPTSEDLTTQISVLRISGKKSNGEGGGVIKTAKKRAFDDSDDTDDAAASGYKRAKMEHWRERFKTF
ncbi:uncharacterized protein FFNC_03218 [Fusarium fujikuroi]|nr:uncharacterized protein FFC1_03764 [Fusarium fujikuroi]SCO33013.1 uncharacterized protein FFNC_03218 [Fusarium fujikuroi]